MEVLTRNNTRFHHNVYHISNTHHALTIFDRNTNSAYPYFQRRPEPITPNHQQTEDVSRFKVESTRLESFNHQWPTDCPVDKRELAQAGLYFTGPADRVQCPWCQGGLYNWAEGDTAFGEHAKHFPSCPFVVSRSTAMISATNSSHVTASAPPMEEPVSHSASESGNWTQLPCVIAILDLGYSKDAIETAVNKLTELGTSTSELTTDLIMDVIFSTENGVVDEEHILEPPTCPVQPQDNPEVNGDNSPQTTTTISMEAMNRQTGKHHGEISRLRQKNENLKSNMTCKICLDARVGELFLPCRHLVCCEECSAAVQTCPLCRERIVGTIKTFL